MYNGIGLRTVRGSATSGHAQANKAHVRASQVRKVTGNNTGANFTDPRKFGGAGRPKANPEIMEHKRKRAIEAKLFEFEEAMADQGYGAAEIERHVAAERRKLEGGGSGGGGRGGGGGGGGSDTHSVAARKEAEMAKLANAFGVPQDFREGESFDPAAAAARRQQRDEEKAARKAARAEEAERRKREAEEARAKRAEEAAKWEADRAARAKRFRDNDGDDDDGGGRGGGRRARRSRSPRSSRSRSPRSGSRSRSYSRSRRRNRSLTLLLLDDPSWKLALGPAITWCQLVWKAATTGESPTLPCLGQLAREHHRAAAPTRVLGTVDLHTH